MTLVLLKDPKKRIQASLIFFHPCVNDAAAMWMEETGEKFRLDDRCHCIETSYSLDGLCSVKVSEVLDALLERRKKRAEVGGERPVPIAVSSCCFYLTTRSGETKARLQEDTFTRTMKDVIGGIIYPLDWTHFDSCHLLFSAAYVRPVPFLPELIPSDVQIHHILRSVSFLRHAP